MNKPVISVYCYLYEDNTALLLVDAAPNVSRVYDPYAISGTWVYIDKKKNRIKAQFVGELNTKRWLSTGKNYRKVNISDAPSCEILLEKKGKILLGKNQHNEKIFLEKK